MANKRYAFDTNALLLNPFALDEADEIVIPFAVIKELDRQKMEGNERGFLAREAIRFILKNEDKIVYGNPDDYGDCSSNDDEIVMTAKDKSATLVTGDYAVRIKCKMNGIGYVDAFALTQKPEYKGYHNIVLSENELADFYQDALYYNEFKLSTNQYLVLRDANEMDIEGDKEVNKVIQALKWNGEFHEVVKTKQVNSNSLGKFTPFDVYQRCALDSVQNNQATIIKGKAGSGKSLLALSYAMHQLESSRGKYEKLICFVNPMAARNSAKLGFYPGTRNEKLLDSAVGSMLGSKFGDKIEVQRMIQDEKLLLLPFSDIRGFDTTGQKAIVYIIEAQNLDVDLMKLAIQRVGEDSKLIIDGDYNSQVDSHYYEGSNNGMRRASEIFRGEDYFGEVELPIIYRSRMARRADQM